MSVIITALVMILILGTTLGWHSMGITVFIVLPVCVPLFYCLTVEANLTYLEIGFGVGLIRDKFFLKDISETYPV